MKKKIIFVCFFITLESIAGPIGCQVGPEYILVGSASCNRFTCKNPAAMAYCYRTYRGRNRFQVAHKNCTAAFCKNFSEEEREDRNGNPKETYRARYEEMAMRDTYMPPFELVKDLYDTLCTEQPYNREANEQLFTRIRVDHLHAIKAQKAAMKSQSSLWSKIHNNGLMPMLGGPPMTMMGSMGMNPMMNGGMGMNGYGGGMGMNPMMGGNMRMGSMMSPQNSKVDPCKAIINNNGNGFGNSMDQSGGQNQFDSNNQQYGNQGQQYGDQGQQYDPYGDQNQQYDQNQQW